MCNNLDANKCRRNIVVLRVFALSAPASFPKKVVLSIHTSECDTCESLATEKLDSVKNEWLIS